MPRGKAGEDKTRTRGKNGRKRFNAHLLIRVHVGEASMAMLAALAADVRHLFLRSVGEVGRVSLGAAHFFFLEKVKV